MSDERFTIKPQDCYWGITDNFSPDKVTIINGLHTKIEAEWACAFLNEQQAKINELEEIILDLTNNAPVVVVRKNE